ncbi:MAG TPA: amidohydrolase family protein [Chthonomonadaceae bacterium]|nr:amidohydrolase family protein [Chthonomonadaceae bacterium]
MKKIDAHIHFAADEPESLGILQENDLKLLNICVATSGPHPWREQAETYRRLIEEDPARFAWCTSFDLPRFDDPQYIEKVLEDLDRDFAAGAIACKVWKNIGMEVLAPSGAFLMPDDPLLDPIYLHITARNKALLMHIAEPLACWQPLDERNPHYGYYSKHPEWHMYGKSGMPSHSELIQARDNVLARHPELRIIGAHLGSLEYDVQEVANRFERFPNFAVDISARLADIAFQDTATVRQFFLDYQDRILFGTDLVSPLSMADQPTEQRERKLAYFKQSYREHFQYLETEDTFEMLGREVQGIGLPPEVLEKVYYTNALRWYPGIE